VSGVTTSSLSLACSLRNWVILDYEEANGLTIRPWAPFLLGRWRIPLVIKELITQFPLIRHAAHSVWVSDLASPPHGTGWVRENIQIQGLNAAQSKFLILFHSLCGFGRLSLNLLAHRRGTRLRLPQSGGLRPVPRHSVGRSLTHWLTRPQEPHIVCHFVVANGEFLGSESLAHQRPEQAHKVSSSTFLFLFVCLWAVLGRLSASVSVNPRPDASRTHGAQEPAAAAAKRCSSNSSWDNHVMAAGKSKPLWQRHALAPQHGEKRRRY